jgi:hypothetical protein
MKLEDYRTVLIVVGLIGTLLIATPAFSMVVCLPGGEAFSELYLLGPEHMAENFPFNIAAGQNYSVYVGAGNHMASPTYYLIYVKFGNSTESLPNATTGAPSPLQPLFEYRFVLEDDAIFESPLSFSIVNASFSSNQFRVKTVDVNGVSFNVDKQVGWDTEQQGFYYRLLVELWSYNPQANNIEYSSRFVYLQLNLTSNTFSP